MGRPYRILLKAGAPREQWLEARRAGIGGSDAAAVLGWGGRHTPLEVYTDKVTDIVRDEHDTEDAAWGRILEDVVAREWARRENRYVRRAPALVQSVRWPWMLASLDRFATAPFSRKIDGLLEVKTRSAWVSKDWDDEIPADVTAQSLHYAAVYGIRRVYVACLVGGQELRTFTLDADPDLLEELAEAERQWWDTYVVARVLPPLTPSADNAAALSRLHPTPDGVLVLDVDGIDLLRRRAKAEEVCKEAKAERAALDDQVRLLLGDRVEGHINGVKYVTWAPSAGSRSTDYERLFTEFPDAYQACVSTGAPSRRLTYSKKAIPS
jgi:putative phage-type endonuclease